MREKSRNSSTTTTKERKTRRKCQKERLSLQLLALAAILALVNSKTGSTASGGGTSSGTAGRPPSGTSCSFGKYFNKDARRCDDCDSKCFKCDELANNCQACKLGAEIQKAEVTRKDGTKKEITKCVCKGGFYAAADGSCKSCLGGADCAQCGLVGGVQKCTRCRTAGTNPVNGKCLGFTPSNGAPKECRKGMSLISGSCQKCPEACLKCSSRTTCTDCGPNTIKKQGSGTAVSCDCAPQSVKDTRSGWCLPCPEGCSVCSSPKSCDTCKTGYLKGMNRECKKADSTNIGGRDTDAGKRKKADGTTEACAVSNCGDCTTSKDTCEICFDGFERRGSKCVPKNPRCEGEGTYNANTSGGTPDCKACALTDCAVCTATKCLRCKNGLKLTRTTGQGSSVTYSCATIGRPTKSDAPFPDNKQVNPATGCSKLGQVRINNNCVSCPVNAARCDDTLVPTECYPEFELLQDADGIKKCILKSRTYKCPPGNRYQIQADTPECVGCSSKCVFCNRLVGCVDCWKDHVQSSDGQTCEFSDKLQKERLGREAEKLRSKGDTATTQGTATATGTTSGTTSGTTGGANQGTAADTRKDAGTEHRMKDNPYKTNRCNRGFFPNPAFNPSTDDESKKCLQCKIAGCDVCDPAGATCYSCAKTHTKINNGAGCQERQNVKKTSQRTRTVNNAEAPSKSGDCPFGKFKTTSGQCDAKCEDPFCGDCSSGVAVCTACFDGWEFGYLNEDDPTEKKCIPKLGADNKGCDAGFYPGGYDEATKSFKCEQCPPGCAVCDQVRCKKCEEGFWKDPKQHCHQGTKPTDVRKVTGDKASRTTSGGTGNAAGSPGTTSGREIDPNTIPENGKCKIGYFYQKTEFKERTGDHKKTAIEEKCIPCHYRCASCENSKSCTTCISGLTVTADGKCKLVTPSTNAQPEADLPQGVTKDPNCPLGQVNGSNGCEECPKNVAVCEKVSGVKVAKACWKGFEYFKDIEEEPDVENECFPKEPEPVKLQTGTAATTGSSSTQTSTKICADGTIPVVVSGKFECSGCPPNCARCSGGKGCQKCNEGFIPNDKGVCERHSKKTSDGFQKLIGVTKGCAPGHLLLANGVTGQKKCAKCEIRGCINCSDGVKTCRVCALGLNRRPDFKTGKIGCFIPRPKGTNLNKCAGGNACVTTCTNAPLRARGCVECSGNQCTKCFAAKQLANGDCHEKPKSDTGCPNYLFLKYTAVKRAPYCAKCPQFCKVCNKLGKCEECAARYKPNASGRCRPEASNTEAKDKYTFSCQEGEYASVEVATTRERISSTSDEIIDTEVEKMICKPCMMGCADCALESPTSKTPICSRCDKEYTPSRDGTKCIKKQPERPKAALPPQTALPDSGCGFGEVFVKELDTCIKCRGGCVSCEIDVDENKRPTQKGCQCLKGQQKYKFKQSSSDTVEIEICGTKIEDQEKICNKGQFLTFDEASAKNYELKPICQYCGKGCAKCTSKLTCNECEPNVNCRRPKVQKALTPEEDVEECGEGNTWLSVIKSCVPCHKTCGACFGDGENRCTKCFAGMKFIVDRKASTETAKVGNCACTLGNYFDKDKKICKACATSGCASCEQRGAKCVECRNGLVLDETANTCSKKCQAGQYFQPKNSNVATASCQNCATGCAKCNGLDNCFECASTDEEVFRGVCQKKCKPNAATPNTGRYRNTRAVCTDCSDPNCSVCSGANQCTTCASGFTLRGKKCLPSCAANEYFTLDKKTKKFACKRCGANCQSCEDRSGKCKTCASGFVPTKDNIPRDCMIKCRANQYRIGASGSTQTCRDCSSDLSNCATCTSGNKCSTCVTGFDINSRNQCSQTCGEGKFRDLGTGACQDCPRGCLGCVSTTKCLPDKGCRGDLQFLFNRCYQACPTGHIRLEESPDTCTKCADNCLTCDTGRACKVCQPGFEKFRGKCFLACAKGKFRDILEDRTITCADCKAPCAACKGGESRCTECGTNLKLYKRRGLCLPACPDGEFRNLKTYKCDKCSANCAQCPSGKKCRICKPGFEKYQMGGERVLCGAKCPAGEFRNFRKPEQLCETCKDDNCKSCSFKRCYECKTGFFIDRERGYCTTCPETDGVYQSKGKLCKKCHKSCATCSAYGKCLTCKDSTLTPVNGLCIKSRPVKTPSQGSSQGSSQTGATRKSFKETRKEKCPEAGTYLWQKKSTTEPVEILEEKCLDCQAPCTKGCLGKDIPSQNRYLCEICDAPDREAIYGRCVCKDQKASSEEGGPCDLKCDPSCKNCIGPRPDQCLQCNGEGFTSTSKLGPGVCVPCAEDPDAHPICANVARKMKRQAQTKKAREDAPDFNAGPIPDEKLKPSVPDRTQSKQEAVGLSFEGIEEFKTELEDEAICEGVIPLNVKDVTRGTDFTAKCGYDEATKEIGYKFDFLKDVGEKVAELTTSPDALRSAGLNQNKDYSDGVTDADLAAEEAAKFPELPPTDPNPEIEVPADEEEVQDDFRRTRRRRRRRRIIEEIRRRIAQSQSSLADSGGPIMQKETFTKTLVGRKTPGKGDMDFAKNMGTIAKVLAIIIIVLGFTATFIKFMSKKTDVDGAYLILVSVIKFFVRGALVNVNFGVLLSLFFDKLFGFDLNLMKKFINEGKFRGSLGGKYDEYLIPVLALNTIPLALVVYLISAITNLVVRFVAKKPTTRLGVQKVHMTIFALTSLDLAFYSCLGLFHHKFWKSGNSVGSYLSFLLGLITFGMVVYDFVLLGISSWKCSDDLATGSKNKLEVIKAEGDDQTSFQKFSYSNMKKDAVEKSKLARMLNFVFLMRLVLMQLLVCNAQKGSSKVMVMLLFQIEIVYIGYFVTTLFRSKPFQNMIVLIQKCLLEFLILAFLGLCMVFSTDPDNTKMTSSKTELLQRLGMVIVFVAILIESIAFVASVFYGLKKKIEPIAKKPVHSVKSSNHKTEFFFF